MYLVHKFTKAMAGQVVTLTVNTVSVPHIKFNLAHGYSVQISSEIKITLY